MSNQPIRLLIFILLTLFTVVSGTSGRNLLHRPTRGVIGFKAGIITRGNVKVNSKQNTYSSETYVKEQSDVGKSCQVFADIPVVKSYYASFAFDFYDMRKKFAEQSIHQWAIDVNIGLKRVFEHRHLKMSFKPGASVGLGFLQGREFFDASEYLTIKFSFETHFHINKMKSWVGELAMLYAPTGGNDDYHVTFGPAFLLRWGIAFR